MVYDWPAARFSRPPVPNPKKPTWVVNQFNEGEVPGESDWRRKKMSVFAFSIVFSPLSPKLLFLGPWCV